MDTLLIILLALTTVAIPALTEAAAAAHIFDAWGTRGVCVKVRLTGLADNTQSPAIPGQDGLSELLGAGGNTPLEIIPLSLC